MSSAFHRRAERRTELTFARTTDSTDDTDESVEAFETAATFDGASGMLKCTGTGGTDCTITLDDGRYGQLAC